MLPLSFLRKPGARRYLAKAGIYTDKIYFYRFLIRSGMTRNAGLTISELKFNKENERFSKP